VAFAIGAGASRRGWVSTVEMVEVVEFVGRDGGDLD
jgi:hypothetical protein